MAEIISAEEGIGGNISSVVVENDPTPSDIYMRSVREANQAAWLSSRIIFSSTESPGGAVELSTLSKAVAGVTAAGVLASSLSLFNTVDATHKSIGHTAKHVPLVGNKLESLVRYLFQWTRPWRQSLIHDGRYYQARLAPWLKQIVDVMISRPSSAAGSALDAKIKQYVNPVHREADTLWAWLQHESQRIDSLYSYTHAPGGRTGVKVGGNVIPLNEQLHSLQARVKLIENTQVALEGQIAAFQAQLSALQGAFSDLSSRVHGVRAVNVGFQDIENQIASLQRQLTHLESQLQPQTTANTNNLRALQPLQVLVTPGARGIDNLRRLEDNPCQCPKLNLPDYLAEALAAYEFVTNG